MKLLVIAYEFPPILSGQSIRWFHLANELAKLGDEVHVLTTRFPNRHGFCGRLHDRVVVHRSFPGPFIGFAAWLSERTRKPAALSPDALSDLGEAAAPPSYPGALHAAYERLRRSLDHLLFPDVRTEWLPFAAGPLDSLLSTERFDLVVSSHEPAVSLLLGLHAQRRFGIRWLVDLGDPVVTPRTPCWRARLDARLEREVCKRADHIVVTCPELVEVLGRNVGTRPEAGGLERKISLVRQGFVCFDERPIRADNQRFTLLFSGTFYRPFRDPDSLVEALRRLTANVELIVVGNNDAFRNVFASLGSRVRVLGMIDHLRCLELQRRATVLVNLGNRQTYQIPGKLFEYLGAGRPILHIAYSEADPGAGLVRSLRRGIVVPNRPENIRIAVEDLYRRWHAGELEREFDLSPERVRGYSWAAQAALLRDQCLRTAETSTHLP